jgi:hypothetical protein
MPLAKNIRVSFPFMSSSLLGIAIARSEGGGFPKDVLSILTFWFR